MNTDLLYLASDEALELIKDEAEKNLLAIVAVDDVLVNKSLNLLNITIGIFAFCIGYLFKIIEHHELSIILIVNIIFILILSSVIFILYGNIIPVKIPLIGSEPKKLLDPDFINETYNHKRTIILNRVNSLQDAINAQHEVRLSRFLKFTLVCRILIYGSIFAFLIGIGIYYFLGDSIPFSI